VKHVVMFSGGIGSWMAARRVVEQHGTKDVTLLFTDTLIEDHDLYRFLDEAAEDVGAPLVRIAEGRTPWQVFRDERFLGNSRIDPCSKILKRQLGDKWLTENCDPADTTVYVGVDWSEIHRFEGQGDRAGLKARKLEQGWRYEAPLTEPPYLTKEEMIAALVKRGIRPPRLYALGFSHNNCGGWCVKAGKGHYARLLEKLPDVYAFHEAQERDFREFIGKDVAILRNADGSPLTLEAFRRLVQGTGCGSLFFDPNDLGGCGCFVTEEAA
jgi:hypothetical protein